MGFFDSLTSTLTSIFDSPWDLHEAACNGDLKRLNTLINKYKPIHGLNYLNHQRWTPLSNALLFAKHDCVMALLNSGANPAARNDAKEHNNTKSGLEHALARKDYPIFRAMLFFWDIPKDINTCELMKFANSKKVVALNPAIVKDILLEVSALKTLMQEIKTKQEEKTNQPLSPRDRYNKIIQVAKKFEALIENESGRPSIREYYRERAYKYYNKALKYLIAQQKNPDLTPIRAKHYKDLLEQVRNKLAAYDDLADNNSTVASESSSNAANKTSSDSTILSKLSDELEDEAATEETALLHHRKTGLSR